MVRNEEQWKQLSYHVYSLLFDLFARMGELLSGMTNDHGLKNFYLIEVMNLLHLLSVEIQPVIHFSTPKLQI